MSRVKQIAKSSLLPPLHYWQRKRRQAELLNKAPSIGRAELKSDLDRVPLPANAVVLVHNSLKSLGFVEGGAQTAVDALIESFVAGRGATVLVPTYSIDGNMHATMKSGRPFDVQPLRAISARSQKPSGGGPKPGAASIPRIPSPLSGPKPNGWCRSTTTPARTSAGERPWGACSRRKVPCSASAAT